MTAMRKSRYKPIQARSPSRHFVASLCGVHRNGSAFCFHRLRKIIKRKVRPDSIVYSDFWKGYNALDVSDFRHFRINHSKHFGIEQNHINGIEITTIKKMG